MATIRFRILDINNNFVLVIPDGCPARFGRAFLLRQIGSCLWDGSAVDRQQVQTPRGICDPENSSTHM